MRNLGLFSLATLTRISPRDTWLNYIIAILLVGLAWWSRALIEPVIGDQIPFATFFVAVGLTAWVGGYGPCLVSVLLGALISWYFVLSPRHALVLPHPYQAFGLTA